MISLTGLIELVFTVSLEFNFNNFNDRVLVKILLDIAMKNSQVLFLYSGLDGSIALAGF